MGVQKEKKICPFCETVNLPGAVTCADCGKALPGNAQTMSERSSCAVAVNNGKVNSVQEDSLQGIPERALYQFVDVRAEHYVETWKKLSRRRIPVSFNFLAFFFGSYWFAARKMIKEAVLYVVAALLLSGLLLFAAAKAEDHREAMIDQYEMALLPAAQQAAQSYYEQRLQSGADDCAILNAQKGVYQEYMEFGDEQIPSTVYVQQGYLSSLISDREYSGRYPFLEPLETREEYQKLAELTSSGGSENWWMGIGWLAVVLLPAIAAGLFGNYFYFRRAEDVYWAHTSQPEQVSRRGGISIGYLAVFIIASSAAVGLAATLFLAIV